MDDYDFTPSLTSMATLRIAASVWCNADILNENGRYYHCGPKVAEDRVVSDINKLSLPDCLRKKILPLIRFVGEQMRIWFKHNKKFLLTKVNVYKEITWTPYGLIDYAKTADNIINHNDLPYVEAFELACINGVGDQVCRLWPEARPFIQSHVNLRSGKIWAKNEEIGHWLYLLSEKFYSAPSVHIHSIDMDFFVKGFRRSTTSCNLAALKFYFQQMNYSRKLKYIQEFHIAPVRNSCTDDCKTYTLLFFLDHMTVSQKDELFRKNPRDALLCFLRWPLQCFFLNVAEKVVSLLSPDAFCTVLMAIVVKIMQSDFEVEMYRSLFRGLFLMASEELRIHCVRDMVGKLLRSLFFPYSPEKALELVYDGEPESIIENGFLSNVDDLMNVLVEDNKHRAFYAALKKFLPTHISEKYFEKSFSVVTQTYRSVYYANSSTAYAYQ